MPTFKYQLIPSVSEQINLDKKEVEDELRRFFRDLLSQCATQKFGWCSISGPGTSDVCSITSTCTEKDFDEMVETCSSKIYVYGNLSGCRSYCFVSIIPLDFSNRIFQVFSTIPTFDLHNLGVEDDYERARDRHNYAANVIGNKVRRLRVHEDNGIVYLQASVDASERDEIVNRCFSSASLNVKKIYGGEIIFLPDWRGSNDKENKIAAEERAATLFGSKTVEDPLTDDRSNFFKRASSADLPTTFRLDQAEFMRRARAISPKEPQATASSFSQWVYSIYGSAYGDDEDRLVGKKVEKSIFENRVAAATSAGNSFLRAKKSDWELVHNGLHLEGADFVKYFKIETLCVNSEPLRASPDLIYRNKLNSDIIIVEIKYSRLPITTNLWPNVWAQLWCYAQLDFALNSRNLTVVGEVWGEKWTPARGQGRSRVEGQPLLCLRASVRRNPRAAAYDNFFRKLFDVYRGEC